jgi:hypothetical protein
MEGFPHALKPSEKRSPRSRLLLDSIYKLDMESFCRVRLNYAGTLGKNPMFFPGMVLKTASLIRQELPILQVNNSGTVTLSSYCFAGAQAFEWYAIVLLSVSMTPSDSRKADFVPPSSYPDPNLTRHPVTSMISALATLFRP